ncbi:hypothetical protein [Moheibacter sp.]|uniref:hypothetical protein n=1 Tax=Moheibacter sp. TaxID=1965316 RepID=UPI003C7626CB
MKYIIFEWSRIANPRYRRYSGNGNIFLGQMSDGKILEICIGPRYGPNMGIIDDFISVPKTCWPKRYIKKNL